MECVVAKLQASINSVYAVLARHSISYHSLGKNGDNVFGFLPLAFYSILKASYFDAQQFY